VGRPKTTTFIISLGGDRFGAYWSMGLPLEILIVVVSILIQRCRNGWMGAIRSTGSRRRIEGNLYRRTHCD